MTDISPEDQDLIDRYLANRLTDREVVVVETRIVEDLGFRNEVELTEALRVGLRELENRGEITPLLSHRNTLWQHPRFALAASFAAVALGVASFLFYQRFDAGPDELVVVTLRFEQLRGAGATPDAIWQQSGVPMRLQLRFDVGLEPADTWQVVVDLATDGASRRILATTAALDDDGLAVVSVESTRLPPGDYRITLTPQASASSQESVVYSLRVAGET